jgi:hypothetical protein
MKCRQIEKKLAAQESLTGSEAAHLNACESCRQFATDIEQFNFLTFHTPAWTKMQTRKAFIKELNEDRDSLSPMRKLEHLIRLPRYIISLTVLFVALFIALLILQSFCDKASIICNSISIFIIVVIVQNMITALFFPILFQGKLNSLK